MAEVGDEDLLPGWRAERDVPLRFGPIAGWLTGVPATVWVVVLAGSGGMSWPLAVLMFVVIVGPVFLLGTLAYLFSRGTVVELRVENDGTATTLTLRRKDGQVLRVPLTQIETVRVTRNPVGSAPVSEIAVHAAGGKRYRTESGPNADVLINVLEAGGATVTTRDVAVPDD